MYSLTNQQFKKEVHSRCEKELDKLGGIPKENQLLDDYPSEISNDISTLRAFVDNWFNKSTKRSHVHDI